MERNEFTPGQLAIVDKNWHIGKHPDCCKGDCFIYGIEIAECKNCKWNDGYVPSGDPYNEK